MTRLKITCLLIFMLAFGLTVYLLFSERKLPANIKVHRLVVYKSRREMVALAKGSVVKTYMISLGGQSIGRKEFEGDMKTPEGLYFINTKNAKSGYHKNLGISYPNKFDIEKAKRLGRPAGGDVKIHGLRNGAGFIGKLHRCCDWTLGCIAVTDQEIDELYNAVNIGTPIEIIP